DAERVDRRRPRADSGRSRLPVADGRGAARPGPPRARGEAEGPVRAGHRRDALRRGAAPGGREGFAPPRALARQGGPDAHHRKREPCGEPDARPGYLHARAREPGCARLPRAHRGAGPERILLVAAPHSLLLTLVGRIIVRIGWRRSGGRDISLARGSLGV